MTFHFPQQGLICRHAGKAHNLGEGDVHRVVPREFVGPRHRIGFPQHVARVPFDLYLQVVQRLQHFGQFRLCALSTGFDGVRHLQDK